MLKSDWLKLPDEVRDFVGGQMDTLVYEIAEKFELSGEQVNFIFDLLDQIFLKKLSPFDLPARLDNMPGAKNYDVRILALDIAYKVLWLTQEYIGEVDKLILRLGGKVPRIKPLRGQIKDNSGLFPGMTQGTVREMMDKYNDFKELRLSTDKLIDAEGRHQSATVDNWLKDYVHFSGAADHDSLKRAQYLGKAPNTLGLSPSERESLRYLLTSHDDNSPVQFDYDNLKLVVSEIVPVQVAKTNSSDGMGQLIGSLRTNLLDIDKKMLPSDFILSEAEGDIMKVRNVLWQALGLSDRDKVISCLKTLIEKKFLDLMIKEDSRFRSILKRFVGIRFGRKAENSWEKNSDQLLVKRLFLEMILVDKLHLNPEEASITAFYLTNLSPDLGQVVYWDQSAGRLEWRAIEAVGDNLQWLDKI